MQPKVTIGIAMYNVEKYILRCCNSIFNQSYKNIEYLFVNDASSDNSLQILKEEIEKANISDANIRIINHTQNKGLSAVRNTIIKHSSGDFIFWLDPDDYIERNCIEILIQEQIKGNFDIVSSDIEVHFRKKNTIIRQPQFKNHLEMTKSLLARTAPVFLCARLIRTNLYKKNGIYAMEGVNYGEDFQVSPKLAFYARKISTINIPLYHYDCTNTNSYTHSFNVEKALEEWKSFESVKKYFLELSPQYITDIKRGEVYKITKDIIGAVKTNNRTYFKRMHCKLDSIEKKYWDSVKFPRSIILYIKNFQLAKIILKFNHLL